MRRAALFRFAEGDLIEQRHAVGLGPQANHAGVRDGSVLHLEDRLPVVAHLEARSREIAVVAQPSWLWCGM